MKEEIALRNAQDRMTDANFERVEAQRSAIREKIAGIPSLQGIWEQVELLMDLVRDYWSGRYRDIPRWVIGALSFALLYFINPVELIPEFVPVIGYLDDIVLLLLVLRLTREHVERYKAWRGQGA
ncbi:DUF1232 domain-containing protein [Methylococcus geothermalis]|uniref:DUF1232 domain-containing protein n=1 Tax=Methylococcus geothermalis TaxID=2681310 RepID=A0A858Q651_9GAMM|nr:DUF1232 domain-containing protein [Methylococcus geothermalis]